MFVKSDKIWDGYQGKTMNVESRLLFFYIACGGWCAWIIKIGSPIGAVRSCHTKGIRANTFSTAKLLSAYTIVKSAFQTTCSFEYRLYMRRQMFLFIEGLHVCWYSRSGRNSFQDDNVVVYMNTHSTAEKPSWEPTSELIEKIVVIIRKVPERQGSLFLRQNDNVLSLVTYKGR